MKNIKLMRENRAQLLAKAKNLVEKAEGESRELTSKELEELKQIRYETEGRAAEIRTAEAEADIEMHDAINREYHPAQRWIDPKTGKEVRTFAGPQRISDYVSKQSGLGEDLSFGKAARAIITGDWSHAEAEGRAMGTTPNADGGYLVPAPLASQVIDLARNLAVCTKAGAVIVPMSSKTLSLAAIDEDPTTEWKEENIAASGATVALREILFTAKTLFCGPIAMSMELAQDAPNAAATVEMAIAGAMAVALDQAALLGVSPNGPEGLINTTGVQEIADIGVMSNYAIFSEAYADLQGTNTAMEKVSFIYNPVVSGELDSWTDQVDQPLNGPPSFVSCAKYVTNQIGNDINGDETLIVAGDFSQLLIGMRLQLTIESSNAALDAWEKYQLLIRGALRCDVQLARPDQFVMLTGINGYQSPGN